MSVMTQAELVSRRKAYEGLKDLEEMTERALQEGDNMAYEFGRQYHECKADLNRIGWSKVNPEVLTGSDPV